MFYLFLISAIILFAIQGILYGKYAREMDGITTAFLRNVSLIVVGLVALLWVPSTAYRDVIDHRPMILLTAGLGIGHIALNYESYKHLPMGIAALLKKVSAVSTGIVVGLIFLGESISTRHLILLGAIVTASLLVGYHRVRDTQPLEASNHRTGIILVTLSGIFNTLSRRGYKTYAEHLDPFLASYVLEASIGIVLLILVPIYRSYTRTRPTITTRNIRNISLISLIVIAGSICFTLALQTGPFLIANTLLILTIPLVFIGGYLLYHEKINTRQLVPIVVVIVCLVLLQIS